MTRPGIDAKPMPTVVRPSLFTLRLPPHHMTARLIGAGAMGVLVLLWWLVTTGLHSEDRLISPVILPSPAERSEMVIRVIGD